MCFKCDPSYKKDYLLKVIGKANLYLHFEYEDPKKVGYIIKEGTKGAAVFHKLEAESFILLTGNTGKLHLVSVDELISSN